MKRIIKLTERDLTRIVKRVINERILNEGELVLMKSSMNPRGGLLAQGYTGEVGWEEKLAKVVGHTKMYKFDGDALGALKASSEKDLSKTNKDIHTVTFTKGNKNVTYIGID